MHLNPADPLAVDELIAARQRWDAENPTSAESAPPAGEQLLPIEAEARQAVFGTAAAAAAVFGAAAAAAQPAGPCEDRPADELTEDDGTD